MITMTTMTTMTTITTTILMLSLSTKLLHPKHLTVLFRHTIPLPMLLPMFPPMLLHIKLIPQLCQPRRFTMQHPQFLILLPMLLIRMQLINTHLKPLQSAMSPILITAIISLRPNMHHKATAILTALPYLIQILGQQLIVAVLTNQTGTAKLSSILLLKLHTNLMLSMLPLPSVKPHLVISSSLSFPTNPL